MTASYKGEGHYFGNNIDLNGSTFAAGAYGRDPGACYIFDLIRGDWLETAQIVDPDSFAWNAFPSDVALSGDRLIIGSRQHENGKGAAFIYRRIHNEWILEQKLMEPEPLEMRHFGSKVDIKHALHHRRRIGRNE